MTVCTAVMANRKNIIILLLLGFASGLPLALTASTLQAWLTSVGFDIKTIGLMTLVGQAYVFKFLWAPLMDRYRLPFLGQRRGWLFLTQFLLALTIFAISFLDPHYHLGYFALLAILIAFFSASQDIAFDAYKTDLLSQQQQGIGAGISVLGYRLAMLLSGGGALLIAGFTHNWQYVYQLMALLMLLSLLVTYWASEPTASTRSPKTLEQAVVIPFKDFFNRNNAWLILLLIILYKFGDALALSLSTTFLMTHFTLPTIGTINKIFGLLATIIGALWGGMLMMKLSLFRALFYFGSLQAFSNIGYWILAITPAAFLNAPAPNGIIAISHLIDHAFTLTQGQLLLGTVIFIENCCGGMATTAFIALLMTLCNKAFSASQFAFLSALSAIGRVYVGPVAAWFVHEYGWATFYLFTIVCALPALVILWLCRDNLAYTERTGEFLPRCHFTKAYHYLFMSLFCGAGCVIGSGVMMIFKRIILHYCDLALADLSLLIRLLLYVGTTLCVSCLILGAMLDYLAINHSSKKQPH